MDSESSGAEMRTAPACGGSVGVSVVIVNYNGMRVLPMCLDSLARSDARAEEVVVVDNGSTDGSLDAALRAHPGIKAIPLGGNSGFAEGCNVGARAARGRIVVFLNSDTVVTPAWLAPLFGALDRDPGVGAVGGKLLLDRNDRDGPTDIVNSAGATLALHGGGFDIGFYDRDGEEYSRGGPQGAVCAAAMAVRRDEFLALGGFDPAHFMYFEDVDLSWRYWLAGYRVLYVPESVVYHKFGGSSEPGRKTLIRVFYGARNSLLNIVKNLSFPYALAGIALHASYNAVRCAGFALTGRFALAWGVVRAYGSALRLLPGALRKRRAIQQGRRVSDGWMFREGLIAGPIGLWREWRRLGHSAGHGTGGKAKGCL